MANILSQSDFIGPLKEQYAARFAGYPKGDVMAEIMAQDMLKQTFEKGLLATGGIAVDGTTGGDAMKLQDITNNIAVAELRMKNYAVLWNWLPKVPTYSDVVELTRLDSWGGFRRGGFLDETAADGGLVATDPSITRKTTPVKWAGGRYMVSRTAMALRALGFNNDPVVGNAEDVSSQSRLEQLVLNLNELSWWGDNTVNAHEPNGVIQQIRASNSYTRPTRINLAGQPLTVDRLADIELVLRSKGALWTDFFWGPKAYADMRKQLVNIVRGQSGTSLVLGNIGSDYLVESWGGSPGQSKFHQDLMLDPPTPDDKFPAGVSAPTRPSQVVVTAVTDSTGNAWGSLLPSGSYTYSVAAVGVNGRSNVCPATTAASGPGGTVTYVAPNGTSQKVRVRITNGSAATQYFEVYRGTTINNRQYLGRVSAAGIAVAADADFYDDGEYVPGCSTSVALTNNPSLGNQADVMIRQLYPMTKVVLPVNVMSVEAAWLTAFTPQIRTPSMNVILENVGRLV